MSDEELNWELVELAARRVGMSIETLAAEMPSGIGAAKLAEL